VYNAQTLELINGSPFSSLQSAASYFNVDYRTIPTSLIYEGGGEGRHLDTKLATIQNNTLVYFFRKEISSEIRNELLKNPNRARNLRTEIWGHTK
jgi:hypothetical protein